LKTQNKKFTELFSLNETIPDISSQKTFAKEEAKKLLSPMDIAVEADSSPSSCASVNEDPDISDEGDFFGMKRLNP